jgi:hypothetical protein
MPKPGTLRRRLLACLTILSLILCLATVGLWVRSYWRYDGVTRDIATAQRVSSCRLLSNFGELAFIIRPYPVGHIEYDTGTTGRSSVAAWWPREARGFGGFGYIRADQSLRAVYCPHWFLALLFAVLPAVRARSILRNRRRFSAGLCQHCGYDLRATPECCPECGRAPEVKCQRSGIRSQRSDRADI